MSKLKIYLARPISGHSYADVVNYYDRLSVELCEAGYKVFHPMTGKESLRNEKEFKSHGYGNPTSTNHAIKARDQWMVRQADIVLTDLSEAKSPSIGCIAELAWADILGKHTVVVMEEGNPNYHAFVLEMASIVFPTLEEAVDYILQFS